MGEEADSLENSVVTELRRDLEEDRAILPPPVKPEEYVIYTSLIDAKYWVLLLWKRDLIL